MQIGSSSKSQTCRISCSLCAIRTRLSSSVTRQKDIFTGPSCTIKGKHILLEKWYLQKQQGDLVQELWKRLTEPLCQERRSEIQNSHQACPRKIVQHAVTVKLIHAAIEGRSSGKRHYNYYVRRKGKFYMWIRLVNRSTAVVT